MALVIGSSSMGMVASPINFSTRSSCVCKAIQPKNISGITRRSVTARVVQTPESVEEMQASLFLPNLPTLADMEVQPVQKTPMQEAMEKRRETKKREQLSYQVSAIASAVGVTSLAVVATYLRFTWHIQDDGIFPWAEMFGTLGLVAGGVYGMEMWARYAHKALWHDYAPGWALHKSHHQARVGPFEANDLFAIMNALPAMGLCLYGFVTPGMLGGTCFGGGLGITLFGIMYMFVHDGLVHRRFPVGPIAELPFMKKLAVAHRLHHAEKYEGAPWGMFLALQELEQIPGAMEEVDRLAAELDFSQH